MSAQFSHSFSPVVGAIVQTAGVKTYEVVASVKRAPDGEVVSYNAIRCHTKQEAEEKSKVMCGVQKMLMDSGAFHG